MANCFVIMPFRPELAYLYRGMKDYLVRQGRLGIRTRGQHGFNVMPPQQLTDLAGQVERRRILERQ